MYIVQYSLYEQKRTRIPKPKRDLKIKQALKILGIIGIFILISGIIITIINLWPSHPKIKIMLGTEGEVIFDGVNAGVGTEFVFEDLEAGLHTINAKPTTEIPFLLEEIEEINLQAGANETIELLSVCQLNITSTPPSARIILKSIDGDLNLGKTPLQTMIPTGHFEVNIRLPGYPEYRQSILTIDLEPIDVDVDLIQIALSEPGAKKLINNLNIGSIRPGASIIINDHEYKESGLHNIKPGIHKTTLRYNKINIITTEVVYPSVGVPVILSCPENISHPCLHFGEGLYEIPSDARDIILSADKRFLLFTTQYRWVYEYVNAVNLKTGKLSWSSDVNSAWDFRPVIVAGTDNAKVYGMSGVPPKYSAVPFTLDLEHGFEGSKFSSDESILPLMGHGIELGDKTIYAQVWTGCFFSSKEIQTGLEVLITGPNYEKRFLKLLKKKWTARFLGVSVSARKDSKPIFIFLASYKNKSHLLILDPALSSDSGDEPKEEPEWITVNIPFKPTGIIPDKGFNTGNGFVIYNENSTASISYKNKNVKWRRYLEPAPQTEPIFQMIKDKPVVLFSFSKSPFELQLDILTGKEVEKRTLPISAQEWYGSPPSIAGVFIRGNTVFAGVHEDDNGGFIHRWSKDFPSGELISTRWGPVHIEDNNFTLLGSHKLESILTFSLPGFISSGDTQVFSTQNHLAIFDDGSGRCWVVDRDGLLKGYYIGISSLNQFGDIVGNALSATIGGKKLIIPWPE